MHCNLSSGTWVHDPTYPLYNYDQCPYITNEYNCRANGRPDSDYEKWRWQPNGCILPRFDAGRLLGRLKGKRLIFVGDSVSLDQFQSMACLLHTIAPDAFIPSRSMLTTFRSAEYNASVEFFWAPFLVQLETTEQGKKILHVDGIEKNEIRWKGVDLLVFE
ncbi:hypothetical protein KI387_034522 [Taxus chinensis]|uniref:Trichome birefringence-like N-terminal domain-containing protein n=1 Tax=Taxus chinensis TaxID=29808 RepID=A0AA38BWP0_TAXCH|nr:hypothetical protein KI387_034522 [Taxus chinensis]